MKLAMKNGVFLAILVLCTACASVPPKTGAVHHLVFVWLKPEYKNQAYVNTLQAETLKLAKIPGVVSLSAGKAIASQRPIVDDSFDLGVIMTFQSVEQMNQYLQHPQHQSFVNQYVKGKAERLTVYDF